MNGIVFLLVNSPRFIKKQLKIYFTGMQQSQKAQRIQKANPRPTYTPPDWVKEYDLLKRGS